MERSWPSAPRRSRIESRMPRPAPSRLPATLLDISWDQASRDDPLRSSFRRLPRLRPPLDDGTRIERRRGATRPLASPRDCPRGGRDTALVVAGRIALSTRPKPPPWTKQSCSRDFRGPTGLLVPRFPPPPAGTWPVQGRAREGHGLCRAMRPTRTDIAVCIVAGALTRIGRHSGDHADGPGTLFAGNKRGQRKSEEEV